MTSRRSKKERQLSALSASESFIESSADKDVSEEVSRSEEEDSFESDSNASVSSSAASNQSSDAVEPSRVARRKTNQRRSAFGTKRSKHRQDRDHHPLTLARAHKQSSWSARERQFEKFRSSFIVLPVPDGAIRIEKARGYSFLVKSVVGWVVPEPIMSSVSTRTLSRTNNNPMSRSEDEGENEDDDEEEELLLTLGVHVSLFHAPSKRFFGNTWVSPEICIDPYQIKPSRDPKSNAVRYVVESVALNVRAYFLTEIVDTNCVGIVELVAYRKDLDSKATISAAGCGWSILPLFAQSVGDIAVSITSTEAVGVFTASPRVLWEVQSASEWPTLSRHEQCKLQYQLQPYDPLLALGTSGFVRRNELVGALEVIPGLKHGNLAGIDAGTNPKLLLLRENNGSGDEEDDDIAAYENTLASFARMASLVPRAIQVDESFTLNVQALRVFMHMRGEVETNLISRLKLSRRTIHDGASSIDDGHVSARVLKIALHNGRCFRTRQHTIPLKVEENGSTGRGGDDIMRCAQAAPTRLKGFVFHPYMAVVVSLQFTVHFRVTWPPRLKQQAMETKPMKILPEDDVVTVTMASRIVIPSDGKKLFLHDREHPSNSNDEGEAVDRQRVLHVDLLSGPPCRPYTENAVYTPPDHILGASRSTQTTFRESIAFADLMLMIDGEDGSKADNKDTEVAGSKHERLPQAAEHWAKRILAKADVNSMLAQTLNALAMTTSSSLPHPPHPPHSPLPSPVKWEEERGSSPVRPASPLKMKAPVYDDPVLIASPGVSTATELSRASKTLLMRYGFVDAHDASEVAPAGGQTGSKATKTGTADIQKTLRPELEDIYKAHEIRLHFAAFRIPPNSPLTTKGRTMPTRLYFTFQFYRFTPTRTETLRLSNSFASSSSSHGSGQTFLLMRENPANKPSLAVQYDVDTTTSHNPLEHREFASYLLAKQLYVDVWDADSLFLLGTCAIPLHELLRQGAGVKKFQGEVEVWESWFTANEMGQPRNSDEITDTDVRCTELTEIKPPGQQTSHHAIGKLQILLSNYGLKGRNAIAPATTDTSARRIDIEKGCAASVSTRAKHRVRARPLVDSNAELFRLLTDQGFYGRSHDDKDDSTRRRQHRQLLKARSAGDATTLTAREIDILCELFRANAPTSAPHATRIACDREGKRGLTALLSLKPPARHTSQPQQQAVIPALKLGHAVPTMPSQPDPAVRLREHLKRVLERAVDKGVRIHQVFMDFDASGDGNLSFDELERALGQLGVVSRPNDAATTATMRQLLVQFDKDGNGSVSYEEFLLSLGIPIEQNKKEVIQTTTIDMESEVREVFSRLQSKGIDIEELFDHFDVDKSGTLDMHELKKAVEQCLQIDSAAKGGQLLASLNEEAVRTLVQRVNQNGDDVVDYREFLVFCGVVRKTPREETRKTRARTQAELKLIKLLLRAMCMGMSIKQLFQEFDSNADGSISVREFAHSLDALFQTKSSLSEEDIGVITKRFDANGDGQISYAEFKGFVEEIRTAQDELTKVFQPFVRQGALAREAESGSRITLTQWVAKCSKEWKLANADVESAVKWMETVDLVDDKQCIDVRNFLLVVSPPSPVSSIERYSAAEKRDFGTRLRDFLQHAVREGVDARGCFAHFDPDGDGEITAAELKLALRQLGREFEDITTSAIDVMVDEIDTDGSGKISFAEFQCLLPASACETTAGVFKKESIAQKTDAVLTWLSDLLAAAVVKGMDIDACFRHFDKDKNGTITREEFALAMQELGMKNADGDVLLAQVMDQIDRDGSGEISLAEFKRLTPRHALSSSSTPMVTPRDNASIEGTQKGTGSTAATAPNSMLSRVGRLRDLLRAAEQSGVSVVQSFAHFDVDKDGSVTRAEFASMIQALPGFEGIADSEISDFVATMDADQSGSISLEEFQAFAHEGGGVLTAAGATASTDEPSASKVMQQSESEKSTQQLPENKGGSKTAQKDIPRITDGDHEVGNKTSVAEDTNLKIVKQPGKDKDAEIAESDEKPKLQRAGSFSGMQPKGPSLKIMGRANTDCESVAEEATKPPQIAAGAKTAARPSLAETRARAKQAMAAKAAVTEEAPCTESGDAVASEEPAAVRAVAPNRRPSLAETRSAAQAAKAEVRETPAESGDVGEAASASKVEMVDEKRPSSAAAEAPQLPTTDSSPDKAPEPSDGPEQSAPLSSRRPTLAKTGVAARTAAKAPAGPKGGKPPTAGAARRPSLAETRAAAAAAKAKSVVSSASTSTAESAHTQRTLRTLQTLLQQAQASGVDLSTALAHFDKDANGKLLYEEFSSGLKVLGSDLTDTSPETARAMAQYIDMAGKGHITLQDFEIFVKTSLAPPTSSAPTPNATPQSAKPGLPRGGSLSARVPPQVRKPPAARSVVSESEARLSIAQTASVPSKPAPTHAQVMSTETLPVDSDLPPAEASGIATFQLTSDAVSEAPTSDYECTYEFSSDPAIRSVEVKLQRAAIDAYSRGMLPLRLVHKFLDSSSSGASKAKSKVGKSELRRVEFLQLLMEMGFSLLSDTNDAVEENDSGAAVHGPRMRDQLYARQLERLARYKHHIKEESRAEKALVRTVQQMQQRAQKQQINKTPTADAASSVNRFVQDKSQLLRVLAYYRDGHKKSLVYSLLRDQVTTPVVLFPSFAALIFAEMHFVNPYPHQERFRLELLTTPATVDADIVTNTDEWRFYRRHVPLSYGVLPTSNNDNVEHDMIDPHNEIVMDANDQIAIPMKLRWLQPTTTSTASKPSATMSLAVRSCTHGHTVALFKLDLYPQPFVCHRVLRFVSPASSVWKWIVRCPRGKHLVCLDASVAAVVESTPTRTATLVTLKCRVGTYPSLEEFFVVVYDDEYFARIDEVWQIRVQSAMRLDVHTVLGQTVCSELVIRGDGAASLQRNQNRHVRCFTTWHHAGLVSFRPAQIFQLVADAYNRIEWRFCATEQPVPSLCSVRVHLVDVETHELVGAWLLHVSLGRPTITKSYELRLPAAQAAQKKIAYTNPWDQPQTIVLRSSDAARMRPRDSVLQLPSQGQIFLRLVFPVAPPPAGRDEGELLLFVNDQHTEQNEECLRFQVSYYN